MDLNLIEYYIIACVIQSEIERLSIATKSTLYISGNFSFITQCGCGDNVVHKDEEVSGNLIRSKRQANSAVLEDALGAILNHFKHQGISIPGLCQIGRAHV